jgi:hypothetical protein
MRFRESAIELFPELIEERVTPCETGEMAIELATSSKQEISTVCESSVEYIVFLNRFSPSEEGLFPFSKQTALQWFEQVVCWGEKRVRDFHFAALRNLLDAKLFELRYKRLDSALCLLESLVRKGPRTAKRILIRAGQPKDA